MNEWIDISVPLQPGIPQWPGDPLFETWKVSELSEGANVTAFSMCAHTGTHIDAPRHYFEGAASAGAAPLDVLLGRAVVTTLDGDWKGAQRVLFRTASSARAWWTEPYREDFEALSAETAHRLVAAAVRLVGIDYLSVGRDSEEGSEVHRILLGAGVWLLEGLNLRDVSLGNYELVCLPVRLEGSDGSPARAILRPLI